MATMTRSQNSGTTFEPCPEVQAQFVLCDIIDLGWKEQVFEGKSNGNHPFIKLVWQSAEIENEDSGIEPQSYLLFDRPMKFSFHEKSTLYKRLAAWLGSKRLEQMLDDGAETEALIGVNAFINVEHSEAPNGNTYANVGSIMALPKQMPKIEVSEYERWHERETWGDGSEKDKKPEYSAFERLPANAQIATTVPPPRAPVERAEFLPSAGDNGDVRPNRARYAPEPAGVASNVATAPDPRSVNKTMAQSMKDARAARVAETADDEDDGLGSVFDDE